MVAVMSNNTIEIYSVSGQLVRRLVLLCQLAEVAQDSLMLKALTLHFFSQDEVWI